MRVTIKDGLLIRNVAGEHVLIDASGKVDFSKMAMLSDTAASVITALQQHGPCTAGELARMIAAEYDVTEEQALADIEELLTALSGNGLVTVRE